MHLLEKPLKALWRDLRKMLTTKSLQKGIKWKIQNCLKHYCRTFLVKVSAYQSPPDPERFFWRKESTVPNYPSPIPNTWACVRGGLMDWYLNLVPYLYLVYWVKDCSSMDWYFYEVHQRYNRYISNAGGRVGIFSERCHFAILEPTVLRNRFSSPPVSRSLHPGT